MALNSCNYIIKYFERIYKKGVFLFAKLLYRNTPLFGVIPILLGNKINSLNLHLRFSLFLPFLVL
jgi:hypothetical protein